VAGSISYTTQFSHKDWIDFVDSVQAGGPNGINGRMHGIQAEFATVSQVIGQLNANLFFQPVGTAGAVAYSGGSVGIGTFTAASPPTHPLEVNLDANTGPAQQVRFGNAVCCNGGAGAFVGHAVFSHNNHASDSNFALRQGPNGNVQINAAAGQPVSIRQHGDNVRLGISIAGNVIVGSETDLPGAGTAVLQVFGDAYKSAGSGSWTTSDARVKEDVRELEAGLTQLRQVRPVRFRYNGLAGTPAGQAGVGVLGQEIEKVFPDMIRLTPCRVEGEPHIEDLRIYDGSAFTFVLINAVKELAGKVEQLEVALAQTRRERGADGTTS
jgi:hypothetical protein